jgi:VanZ family protein
VPKIYKILTLRFVPGRTSSVYDVMIDSRGAFVFLLCLFLWKKKKERTGAKALV